MEKSINNVPPQSLSSPKEQPGQKKDPDILEAPASSQTKTETVDGGLRGWMTVLGAWLIFFSSLGYSYSFGVYQDYYTRFYLTTSSPSSIAWMGSFQLAFPFIGGVFVGRLVDAGHSRTLIFFGSLLFIFSLFMLSLAKPEKYYQIFLSQGVGMGIGTACIFAPTYTLVNVSFRRRRSFAYGVALTGVSFGAVCYPITLNQLLPRIGFGSSVRATAYICVGLMSIGNILIRSPMPMRRIDSRPSMKMFFKDPPYVAFLFGSTTALFGLYMPLIYLQFYAIEHGIKEQLAFYSVAIVNGSSIIGRIAGNYFADIYGIWNIQIPTTFVTGVMVWATLGIKDSASLVVISILYGIASGAWLSLTTSAAGTLASSTQEIGARVSIAFAIVCLGLLFSGPVQGALLTSSLLWIRPVGFSGSVVLLSIVFYSTIRFIVSKRRNTQLV